MRLAARWEPDSEHEDLPGVEEQPRGCRVQWSDHDSDLYYITDPTHVDKSSKASRVGSCLVVLHLLVELVLRHALLDPLRALLVPPFWCGNDCECGPSWGLGLWMGFSGSGRGRHGRGLWEKKGRRTGRVSWLVKLGVAGRG